LDGKILRAVSPAFAEDPLRVLRVCQFAARFDATVEEGTVTLCRSLVDEMRTLPTERFWEEVKKLLLKSKKPSRGLEAMREVGALSLFPELEALIGVPQDPVWHPEGCVWTHNNMVVDAAVRVLSEDGVTDEDERLVVLLGALCHDLGKPLVTEFKEGKDGPRWRAHDHEEQGVEPTRSFLARIGCPPYLVEPVVAIVASHLKPFQMYRDQASASAIRRLALKVNMTQLCRVARADFLGRTTPDALSCADSREIPDTVWFMEQASRLKVTMSAPAPIVMGRHLLEKGFIQGPKMGEMLKEIFQRQLDGEFEDLTGGLEVLERLMTRV
jgi:tRNA nucleotidyltransferase (CCA-adding enzyme)